MMTKVWTIFIAFCCAFAFSCNTRAFAQQSTLVDINGVVLREAPVSSPEAANYPLGDCVVKIYFQKEGQLDSLYSISNQFSGQFSFKNVPAQRVVMRLQCLGFETISETVNLAPGDNLFSFTMKEKSEQLKEAKVSASVPLLKMLNDTTFVNTQAIRTMDGESLREALSQVPGFTVNGNEILIDGQRVEKAYVNGVLVFGDDPTRAINTLKAEEVTQVKVYDKKRSIDEHRGKLNSRKERVIDIITKESFLSQTDGALALGGGFDANGQKLYGSAIALQHDSEMLNVFASASANNYFSANREITESSQVYSYLDPTGARSEYKETEAVNFLLTKHWNNREFGNSFRSTYNYDHRYSRSARKALTDYFKTEDNPEISELDSLSSMTGEMMHKARLSLALVDTKLKSLGFDVFGGLSDKDNSRRSISTVKAAGIDSYSRDESSRSTAKNYNLGGIFSWSNDDATKWRPSLTMAAEVENNTTLSWTVDTLETSFLKRQLTSDGYGKSYHASMNASINGCIVNNTNHTLEARLNVISSYNKSTEKQMSVNEWDVLTPVTDLANSYDFTRNELKSQAALSLSYHSDRIMEASATASINNSRLLDDEHFPYDFTNKKSYIYPEFIIGLTSKHFAIQSSMETVVPLTEQIRNRISDSNPLVLTAGNPTLRPETSWKASLIYNSRVKVKENGNANTFTATINGICTFNDIVSRSIYFDDDTYLNEWDGYLAKAGSMLYTFDNAKTPALSVGAHTDYGISFLQNRLSARLTLNSSYVRTPAYAGETQIWMNELLNSGSFKLNFSASRKLSFRNSTGLTLANSFGQDGGEISKRMIITNSSNFSHMLCSRIKWVTLYSLNAFRYLDGIGENSCAHVLSTGISALLVKDQELEISIRGCDLLNSGKVYNCNVSASSMNQTWAPTYGRYLIVTLSSRLTHRRQQ